MAPAATAPRAATLGHPRPRHDKGKVWIAAKIRYTAVAPFLYNLFDWVAHDEDGTQYQPAGFVPDQQLQAGTLATGRKVEGWVPFEVPTSVKTLWIDYAPAAGVIFSVKVYTK